MDILAQRELIETYLRAAGEQASPFSFISLFAWRRFFTFELEVIDGNLCVFASDTAGTFLYLPPLGKTVSPKAVDEAFRRMDKFNRGGSISRIENVTARSLAAFPETKFDIYKKATDYIYRREELAGLRGNAFKSKRPLYHFAKRTYQPEVRPFRFEDTEECLSLYDAWAQERAAKHPEETYRYMLEDSRKMHEDLMRHAEELGLLGRVVRINGKVRAYTFGCPLSAGMFCVLLEVADLGMKGLSVYVFRELCADAELTGYPFINAMDDFAVKSVEQTKLSFRPVVLSPLYVVSLKKEAR